MNALSNPAVAAPPETLLNRPFLLVLMVAAVFGFSFSSFFLLPKFLSVALAADAVSIGSSPNAKNALTSSYSNTR